MKIAYSNPYFWNLKDECCIVTQAETMASFVLTLSILQKMKKPQVNLNINGLIRRVTCYSLAAYNSRRV